jgi:hypothetical protein
MIEWAEIPRSDRLAGCVVASSVVSRAARRGESIVSVYSSTIDGDAIGPIIVAGYGK